MHSDPATAVSRPSGGFTLIELVVVIAIISLLAAVAIPATARLMDNQTADETAARMEAVGTAIRSFARDNLGLPADLGYLNQVPGGVSLPGWRGPYVGNSMAGWSGTVSAWQQDNWGVPYAWTPSGTLGTLRSRGPDGAADTADDIVLQVDIRPELRTITIDRMQTLNIAIRNYNQTLHNTSPLPSGLSAMLQRLAATSYIATPYTALQTDAFGSAWTVMGSPVTGVSSPNVPAGF